MKKSTLSIQFRVPPNCSISLLRINGSKEFEFFDENGNKVLPEYIERTTHFARKKGPKIQARSRIENGSVSIEGIAELANYDSIFVTDANTISLNNEKVSAACFICLRAFSTPEGTIVDVEKKINIYDFRGCSGNPEMLAILKVINDVRRSAGDNPIKIAFVTDSELGNHDAINSRKHPLYGNHYLPEGFSLMYASSDTGNSFLNQMIKFCDKQSSSYLDTCGVNQLDRKLYITLAEDNSVLYKYLFREDFEFSMVKKSAS